MGATILYTTINGLENDVPTSTRNIPASQVNLVSRVLCFAIHHLPTLFNDNFTGIFARWLLGILISEIIHFLIRKNLFDWSRNEQE